MEKNEGFHFPDENEKEKILNREYDRLLKVLECLQSMGFTIIDIPKDMLSDRSTAGEFSLVMDESNGIRGSFSYSRGLVVWFTNGFENPKNPRRREVIETLKNNNLI